MTARLSERQLAIIALAAEGAANKEIGERLSIAEDTVKTHLRVAFRRLKARTRAHAVAICIRTGLLEVGR